MSLLFESLHQATDDARRLVDYLGDTQGSVWAVEPPGRFGPGEVMAHLVQSESFALSFLMPAAGIGTPFVLPEPFKPIVGMRGEEKHAALSKLNLRGARSFRRRFGTFGDLQELWLRKRRDAQTQLLSVPDGKHRIQVSHPLVFLKGSWGHLVQVLFVSHIYYHLKQMHDVMVEFGLTNTPFPFGQMD